MKLTRRGHILPNALRAATYLRNQAQGVMETRISRLSSEATPDEMATALAAEPDATFLVVAAEDRVIGFLTAAAVCRAAARGTTTAGEAADRRFATVSIAASMEGVIGAMRAAGATMVFVAERTGPFLAYTDVRGVVTAQQLAQALLDEGAFFLDA
jgi:predicted transcriptional regulator